MDDSRGSSENSISLSQTQILKLMSRYVALGNPRIESEEPAEILETDRRLDRNEHISLNITVTPMHQPILHTHILTWL
jgi:hypothetical protein